MKRKIRFIEQMEHSECGLACLGMMLGHYGCQVGLPELRDRFGTSPKGSSLMDMIRMGEAFHLKGKAYKAGPNLLTQVPLPAVLFWDHKHYVVLERIKGHTFTIIDPSHGRQKLSPEDFLSHYSGVVLAFEPDEQFKPYKGKRKLNFLLIHLFKQKKLLCWILLAAFFLQGVGLIVPHLTQWVVDNVLVPANQGYLSVIGLVVLGLYLFHQVFSYLRGYLIAKLQTGMDLSLMSAFITKLFQLPYAFFDSRTSGDLIFRANSNVMMRQILSSRVISLVIDTVLIIGYAIMMFYMESRLAWMVLGMSLLVILSLLISRRWVKRLSDRSVSAQSKVQGYMAESITGITDIKMLGLETKVFRQWKDLFQKQLTVAERQSILNSSLDAFSTGINFATPLTLLWLGSSFVVSGQLSAGQLLGFSSLASQFMMPIISFSMTYAQFLALGAYLHRLQDVMESESEKQGGMKPEHMAQTLELNDVTFKYDFSGKPVLSSIHLTIQPGEIVAVVGESGSGKSTLARLVLGLLEPSEGEIRFGGKPLVDVDRTYWRSQIGAVLQETRLFHGSILDNIRLLDENIPMEAVIQAATLANIHEEILKEPMGYFTMVSEGGGNFSGGQRQRLLLARALVNQPRLLILDEATSALDNLSEARIQHNLKNIRCTQIVIAHRLSTIIQADRIVVLHQGEIVESGTHEELMQKNGFYYELYTAERKRTHEEMVI